LSQPILSQSRGAPQAGGGDHRWLADTAGSGAGEPERKRTTEARRCGSSTCNIWWSLEGAKVRLSEEDLRALHQLPRVNGAPANGAYIYPGKRHRTCLEMDLASATISRALGKVPLRHFSRPIVWPAKPRRGLNQCRQSEVELLPTGAAASSGSSAEGNPVLPPGSRVSRERCETPHHDVATICHAKQPVIACWVS
jgi:hypothetical protein